ncbi:hypothetical protein CRG98_041233 [Punica granatum]|uniref:Disease resistance R13L4/SHOC-2-like LRR domain-containing protein n=1 Tax=Punica granatum TaxID=22663 RepID=A0A2I0I363_PUNGR|nr:hypothetical protein CRG98_041233 [Punica granatum]
MSEQSPNQLPQGPLNVEPVLDSISGLVDLVREVQKSIPFPDAHGQNDASSAQEDANGGASCFNLCSSAGRKVSASQGVTAEPSSGGGSITLCLTRLVSAGKKGATSAKPVEDGASTGTQTREVKAAAEPKAKAMSDKKDPADPTAVTGPIDGGSPISSKEEVKKEAADAVSSGRSPSRDRKGGSSQQTNGPAVNGLVDDPKVNGESTTVSSTRRHMGDNLKVYNQAEKLLRDLNYIKSELSKLKGLGSGFEGRNDPREQLLQVFNKRNTAPSFPTQALHEELQSLAEKVKGMKNQMPGRSALATSSEAGHQVVKEVAFRAYHLLDNKLSSDIKERIQGTPCFDEFLEYFVQAFRSLDLESKLRLLCFSIFPEDAVVHKKVLVYWWIGEGLVDPQMPEDKKTAGEGLADPQLPEDKKSAGEGLAGPQLPEDKKTAGEGLAGPQLPEDKKTDGDGLVDPKLPKHKTKPPQLPGDKTVTINNVPTANDVLKKLCSKGFINPVLKKGKLSGFKMDPLVRFVVVILAERLGFFSFDTTGIPTADFSSSHRACLVHNRDGNLSRRALISEKNSESSSKGKDKDKDTGHSHTDPIRGKNSESSNKDKDKDMDHLHTLFNVNDPYPDFKLDWFSKLKMLNVLYLGGWQGSKGHHIEVESTEFLRGLKNMKYLKFLSLQGISRITELPDSLCALTNLRILDLNACHHLESLPKKLEELKNLTHLDISECYLLDHIPKGLGQLKQLQVLKGFVVGGMGNNKELCSLVDLKELEKLRKLSITSSRDDFPSENEVAVLRDFPLLKKLTIAWGGKSSKAPADNANGTLREKGTKGDTAISKEGKGKPADEKKVDKDTFREQNDKGDKAVRSQQSAQPASAAKLNPTTSLSKKVAKTVSFRSPAPGTIASVPEVSSKLEIDSPKSRQAMKSQQSAQSTSAAKLTSTISKKFARAVSPRSPAPSTPPSASEVSSKLEKLELQCYPLANAPGWMVKGELKPSKKLYIRGGNLRTFQDGLGKGVTWDVKILCLKYLADLEMDWRDLQKSFPELVYLEKSCCPKLTFFPCNSSGVWINRKSGLLDKVKEDLSWSFLA